jgi:hypothetical protein
MTAEEWIAAYAVALGRPVPTREEMDAVLALASTAAHTSERRAAPIACWLAASAGVSLAEAQARAEQVAA